MKKLLFAILNFAFLSTWAQTADEVIQKYSANLGGLDTFNKIKTAKFTATYTTQGIDLPMTIQVINGKASRSDVEAMGSQVIRVYNDGKGWTQNPFAGISSPKEATGAELNDLKSQSLLAPTLMDYKARGRQAELLGQVEVEGIKTFKIKLTGNDNGKATIYYINTADYTLLKSESDQEMQGQPVTIETWYSNLKEFNGAKFFMTRFQKMNGETFQTTTFTNIELNVPIDEKIFDMPK